MLPPSSVLQEQLNQEGELGFCLTPLFYHRHPFVDAVLMHGEGAPPVSAAHLGITTEGLKTAVPFPRNTVHVLHVKSPPRARESRNGAGGSQQVPQPWWHFTNYGLPRLRAGRAVREAVSCRDVPPVLLCDHCHSGCLSAVVRHGTAHVRGLWWTSLQPRSPEPCSQTPQRAVGFTPSSADASAHHGTVPAGMC